MNYKPLSLLYVDPVDLIRDCHPGGPAHSQLYCFQILAIVRLLLLLSPLFKHSGCSRIAYSLV